MQNQSLVGPLIHWSEEDETGHSRLTITAIFEVPTKEFREVMGEAFGKNNSRELENIAQVFWSLMTDVCQARLDDSGLGFLIVAGVLADLELRYKHSLK